MVSIATAPLHISGSSTEFQFLRVLTDVPLFCFDGGHPNGCEVISHCGFDSRFPLNWRRCASFMWLLVTCTSLRSISSFVHF